MGVWRDRMVGVSCTVYSVQCTWYTVHCTYYVLQCSLYNVPCIVYCVEYTLYICSVYNVHCTVAIVYITGFDVQCTLYTIHCAQFNTHCILYNILRLHITTSISTIIGARSLLHFIQKLGILYVCGNSNNIIYSKTPMNKIFTDDTHGDTGMAITKKESIPYRYLVCTNIKNPLQNSP